MNEKPLVVVLTACPSKKDAPLVQELAQHFRTISGAFELWDRTHVGPSSDEVAERDRALERAAVIVAMMSVDALADPSWIGAVQRSLDLGKTVVPVLLRACAWKDSLLGNLACLPKNSVALSNSRYRDQACTEIAMAVRDLTVPRSAAEEPPPEREDPSVGMSETSFQKARLAYLEGIERHIEQTHPLGLPSDLSTDRPVALTDLWTPLRIVRADGADSETLISIVLPAAGQRPATTDGRAPTTAIWRLVGDPGSGKSWAMLHLAAGLAAQARSSPDSPLPLLVTARGLTESQRSEKGVRTHATTIGAAIEPLLQSQETRWIALVDGLDEAGEDGRTAIANLMAWLGPRLATLVVSSRPTYLPRLGLVQSDLRLAPWTEADVHAFLGRWETFAPNAVARLCEPSIRVSVASLLSSPQTATLCVLAAEGGGPILDNHARLVEYVLQTLWKRRSEKRARDTGIAAIPWETVAPALREIALAYLSSGLRSLGEDDIRQVLERHHPDMAGRIEDALILHVGLLTRVRPGQADFPFRVMAEHLSGRAIWNRCLEKRSVVLFSTLSHHRWAEEPLRLAILWAHAQSGIPRATELIDLLLAGEDKDSICFSNEHLRPVLIAIRTAADLDLPTATARRLRRAAFRRIVDESSSWVGERMADAVRTLAARSPRHAVPLFRALVRVASDVRQSPAAWYAKRDFEVPELWACLFYHRDPEVRAVANDRLGRWKERIDVIEWLFLSLNEDSHVTGGVNPAFAAATVLRDTDRGLWPEGSIEELRARLKTPSQLLAGGAAIILKPQEASPVLLARAFRARILTLGAPPSALRDLAATTEGLAALETEWPEWRAALQQPGRTLFVMKERTWGDFPPPSAMVRERLWSAVGRWAMLHPKISKYRRASRSVFIFQGVIRACEAIEQDPSAVDELFDRFKDEPIRHWELPAIEALARAALRHPHVAKRLISEWDRVRARQGFMGMEYPGDALDLLVASGDRDAARVMAEWLPSSPRLSLPRADTPMPAAVVRNPTVRPAALAVARDAWAKIEATSREHVAQTPYSDLLAVLWAAWYEEPDLRERYESWLLREENGRFLSALTMGRHLPRDPEVLAAVGERIEKLGRAAIERSQRDGDEWIGGLNSCNQLVNEVDAWHLEDRCASFLISLLESGRLRDSHQQACALLARASPPDWAVVFARGAARASASLFGLDLELLRLVVDLAPAAHAAKLILVGCHHVAPTKESLAVLEMLPPRLQRAVIRRWRPAYKDMELPWSSDNRPLREFRPADRLRGTMFDLDPFAPRGPAKARAV